MAVKIFISHSSKDEEIAASVIALLRASLNLKSREVVCTSVSGYKLSVGDDIGLALKKKVMEAKTCIGIITPVSVESAYVLFELGARWGADLFIAPILAAGATPSLLRGPLSQTHALSCEKRQDLQQLVSNLATQLQVKIEEPQVYEKELAALLNADAKQHERETLGQVTRPFRVPDTRVIREIEIEPAADATICDEDITPVSVTRVTALIEREASTFLRSDLARITLTQTKETSGTLTLHVPILLNHQLTLLEFATDSVLQDFPLRLTEYLSGDDKTVHEIKDEAELSAVLQRTFESEGAKSKISKILQRAKGKIAIPE
ncbi:MAG: toll/interleukin-1 receptor domain-containing protein [Planctomycetes bacterium]|nr:toll/interleukin-1 receptor domain-containing protein [Planctomycetota bacterium]